MPESASPTDESAPSSAPQSLAPRCLTCSYVLALLPSPGKCPECGCRFDLADPATFSFQVPFTRWKYWLPGLVLAAGGGAVVFTALVQAMNSWVWALLIGLPYAAGCLLGYGVRVHLLGLASLTLVALIALAILIFGTASLGLASVIFATAISAIMVGSILVGAVTGWCTRQAFKVSTFSQRSYLP